MRATIQRIWVSLSGDADLCGVSAKRRRAGRAFPRASWRAFTVAIASVAILVAVAPGQRLAAQEMILKFSIANPPAHPSVLALNEVAKMLASRSNGRIKMEVFPGGQLGGNLDNIDQVGKGSIDMTMQNPAITAQVVPEMGVFSAPFLFPTLEAAYKAAASPIGQEIADKLRTSKNLRALDPWYLGGWNLFTNKKLVHECKDLKGMKLRVPPAPVLKNFFEQCGAGVVAMDFTEVYLSLNTGVIDGIPMPLAIIESAKLNEVTKFVTLHTYLYDLFHPLINEGVWQSLSPADQTLLRDAFAEGRKINDRLAAKQETSAASLFAENNVDRNPDVESFVRAARKTWAVFEDKWGGQETIKALEAAAK